jgi:hypothetical protein
MLGQVEIKDDIRDVVWSSGRIWEVGRDRVLLWGSVRFLTSRERDGERVMYGEVEVSLHLAVLSRSSHPLNTRQGLISWCRTD